MLDNIAVAWMCAAFVAAAAHIFMLILFTAEDLVIALRVGAIHVAFARFSCEEVTAYDDMLDLVDWHGNPFVEDIHLSVP